MHTFTFQINVRLSLKQRFFFLFLFFSYRKPLNLIDSRNAHGLNKVAKKCSANNGVQAE